MTTRCHSVRSWRLPSLSFQFSDVATRMFTTSPPLLSERTSGSSPRLPTNITLLTPAIPSSSSPCESHRPSRPARQDSDSGGLRVAAVEDEIAKRQQQDGYRLRGQRLHRREDPQ